MVNSIRVLFCALACFFSITVYANDPIRKNFNKHVKNQEAYQMHTQRAAANVIADIKMGAPDSSQRTSVKQMLERSGVLEDGSKVKIGASVTRPVDTAKVASTLVDRLKNAKDYAKHVGKASIPAFVGTAALTGLIEGIGWVIDEGGQVQRINPDLQDPTYSDIYQYSCAGQITDTANSCGSAYLANCKLDGLNCAIDSIKSCSVGGNVGCSYNKHPYYGSGTIYATVGIKIPRTSTPQPEIPVPDQDIEEALKNALESNNAALAAAIAEAMKAAYTQDNSEGQPKTTNPLIAEIQDDMQSAVDGALDNPTTSGGTAERPSGHYKITDGEKTIEGYVTPSDTSGQTNTDTESNTVTDPITGNQTTTGTSTGSIQFPAFCDWAGIVCEWIGWTKEEPEEPQIEPPVIEQIDIPFVPFSITQFNATCPPDQQLSLDLMGTNQSFVLPMTPFCDFFSSIKPFVIALASFFAVKLIGNGAFNSGN